MLDGGPNDLRRDDLGIAYIDAQHDNIQHLGVAHFQGHLGNGGLDQLDIITADVIADDGAIDEQGAALLQGGQELLKGRDMDKVKATGLSPLFTENGSITFEQARLTFECKKLYADLIKPGNFIDKSITDRWYGESHGGFHKMYVVEIVNVLSR